IADADTQMTPRQRVRRGKRGGRRKARGGAVVPAAARDPRGRLADAVPTEVGIKAGGWWPRPGPGSTIGRPVLAGFLPGPGLGLALGPWLARNRLPLYEAQAPWLGAAPILADWPHPPGPGEGAEARKAGERALLVAWAPTAAGAETLALELALPRLSRSPELSSARDGRRESWAAALLAGPAATLTPAGDCAARLPRSAPAPPA